MKVIIVALVIGFCLCQSEQSWEQKYLGIPSASAAYEHLAYYTSLPHLAGTPGDYETAVYTATKFQEYGLEASIEEEIALLTYPVSRLVQVTYPDGSSYTCTLQEDYEPVDPTSGDPRVVPTFNGYSPSGDVTSQAVYVNYGRKEDFETLVSMNVTLEGNIAIARYGSIFRGTKAMIAQEYGMVGLIIYSDPADDGYARGPVYPEGPWRSNSSVQRGSVLFLSVCPGNPTRDLCVSEADRPNYSYTQVVPSIPVQPISYGDALPILSSLKGPEAPASFVGALPITYYLGPGPSTVRLNLEMEFVNTTIWNVVGKIAPDPSSPVKSEQVLIGNHRDAWVFGAVDPSSGSAMLLEVARGYGELLKQGWKPQRELIFLSWDAEEYGLVGSTAYAERHADSLSANAVVYINVDSAVSGGSFSVEATPSLNDLIRNVSTSVPYPGTSGSLRDNWSGVVGVLGSGSDYTAFIDHYGIPCLSMGMNGAYGVYHSVYDSMHWMEAFGDPTFNYFVTMAQQTGLLGMRIADTVLIPYNFTVYAQALNAYLAVSKQVAVQNDIDLDYSSLENAITAFTSAAAQTASDIDQSSGTYDPELNQRLLYTERQFLGYGIPLRPYYRHVVQAPGLYQGYAPETFPGINQALRASNAAEAQLELETTANFINNAAVYLQTGSTLKF